MQKSFSWLSIKQEAILRNLFREELLKLWEVQYKIHQTTWRFQASWRLQSWGYPGFNQVIEQKRKMLNIKEIDGKPQITYPCRWPFKVIGRQKEELFKAVSTIVADSDHTLTHSKESRSGKYHSLNLEIFVESEESRNYFFNELRTHSAVTMVF